jgi:ATP-dependent Clp protease adapter protein ClpS
MTERELVPTVEAGTSTTTEQLPPYLLIGINDENVDYTDVVIAIEKILHVDYKVAKSLADAAQAKGEATWAKTHRERAELYEQLFSERGIPVRIEPLG